MTGTDVERPGSPGRGSLPKGGFCLLVPELSVTDIGISLAFWCNQLGFEIAYERPLAKFAFLQREGAQVMLEQVNGNWATGRLSQPFGRGVNFQFMVSDLAPILSALEMAGRSLFCEPYEVWYRAGDIHEVGLHEFLVQDPDGYLLRFAERIGERISAV